LDYKSFLSKIEPFDTLSIGDFDEILSNLDILYFKKNDTVAKMDTEPEYYIIIGKGAISEIDKDDNVSILTSKDSFDAGSILQNKYRNSYVCVEESICFCIKKEIFGKILKTSPKFESYYLDDISKKMHSMLERDTNKNTASFMATRVENIHLREAHFIDEDKSIIEGVGVMSENGSDSLIIRFKDGRYGIVTNTDLREKVILQNRPYTDHVGNISIKNLKTISSNDFLFNALLMLIENNIQRLAVTRDGEIIGILEQVDLLSAISSKAHLSNMQILRARNIEELKEASGNVIFLIHSLQQHGVKVRHITKLLSDLNMKIYRRLFELLAPKGLQENSALIVLGSEGRREQTLRTDQDNALIIRDGFICDGVVEFAEKFNATLIDFGFPPCEGGIMVSNPLWRKELKGFVNDVESWVLEPSGNNIMNLAILFDASYVAGDKVLLESLKNSIYESIQDHKGFFAHFAKATLAFETPLSLFSNFVTGKDKHKNELDIKKGGIFPIVHGVRSLALEKHFESTNTIERIKELNNIGLIDRAFSTELIEAFTFLLTLRLQNQLKKVELKQDVDNYINPSDLSKFERDLLRDVFKIVDKFKKYITYHFKLNMVG